MAQEKVQLCPACGAPRDSAGGLGCSSCGFSAAFVTYFASPEAEEAWRAQLRRFAPVPLALKQALLADRLTLGRHHVSILLDKALYLADGVYEETERDWDALQVSRGDRHTAVLLRDGTVKARGSNEYAQCDVSSLRSIRQVIAASRCTYALREDGRVQLAGVTGSLTLPTEQLPGKALPVLAGWDSIVRLAWGGDHLAGVTADGRILVGGFPPALQDRIASQASCLCHVKAITAAPGNYTLVLLEDGTVRSLGDDSDPRGAVSDWKNITGIAAESGYAVGMTSDGHIRLAGRVSPILDGGRSSAAGWENIAAVVCGHSAIAAVTGDGELLLAGNLPRRDSLLNAWDRDIRPELADFLRHILSP